MQKIGPPQPPQILSPKIPTETTLPKFDASAYLNAYQNFINNIDPKKIESLWATYLDRFRAIPDVLLNKTLDGSEATPALTFQRANDFHETLKSGVAFTVDKGVTGSEAINFYEFIKQSNDILIEAKQAINEAHVDITLSIRE